ARRHDPGVALEALDGVLDQRLHALLEAGLPGRRVAGSRRPGDARAVAHGARRTVDGLAVDVFGFAARCVADVGRGFTLGLAVVRNFGVARGLVAGRRVRVAVARG